jgi:hypothetical protein
MFAFWRKVLRIFGAHYSVNERLNWIIEELINSEYLGLYLNKNYLLLIDFI